jgi:hypothetical protein
MCNASSPSDFDLLCKLSISLIMCSKINYYWFKNLLPCVPSVNVRLLVLTFKTQEVTVWFTDPVFIYHASVAVSKLRLPSWSEPFAGQQSVSFLWLSIRYPKLVHMNQLCADNTNQRILLNKAPTYKCSIEWLIIVLVEFWECGHCERSLVFLIKDLLSRLV